jgi:hypothetical protein
VMHRAIGVGAHIAEFAFVSPVGNNGLSGVLACLVLRGRIASGIGALCGVWTNCKSFWLVPRRRKTRKPTVPLTA